MIRTYLLVTAILATFGMSPTSARAEELPPPVENISVAGAPVGRCAFACADQLTGVVDDGVCFDSCRSVAERVCGDNQTTIDRLQFHPGVGGQLPSADLVGTELNNLVNPTGSEFPPNSGKQRFKGRYPIHFHMNGTVHN